LAQTALAPATFDFQRKDLPTRSSHEIQDPFMFRAPYLLSFVFALAWLCFSLPTPLDAEEKLDFNRDIRPILSENCFYCHGQDKNKREGDLRLDDRDAAIAAGAVVPSDVMASEIIQRLESQDPDTVMPPPNSNRHISAEQKQTLRRWIEQGATYSNHWAFITPQRPNEPNVKQTEWIRNPIDRFVLAELETRGLTPSPEADRTTLIKRLYADLAGIPPTPDDVDNFVKDTDPLAYEKLVDRLMNASTYGERMSLAWLDTARYADSNGFQQDGDTWQWYWRDWVVRALNENLPFDKFTIYQLAGDLLPEATLDQKIASGFNRNHLLNGEGGAIAEEQRFVILFDRIDTTATTWLGLTMACAQCHDHKYDPITMTDYYSLMDCFNRVPESGVPQYFSSRVRVAAPFVEIPTEENQTKIAEWEVKINELRPAMNQWLDAAYQGWKVGVLTDGKPEDGKALPERLVSLLKKADQERTEDEKKELESLLRKHFDEKIVNQLGDAVPNRNTIKSLQDQLNAYRQDQIPRVMVMSDAQPRETHILDRGAYLTPREKVSFTTPAFLPPMPDDYPKNRLGLAQWLMSPQHPLTSRVQVNRIWQHYFGQGIIKTAEDFGVQSEYPIHLPLLDWLACEFRDGGWNMKAIHRLIVTSATYRQSSRVTQDLLAADVENRLYGRATRYRMPAMILRDWALASSGLLDPRIGGKPVYPYQPDGIWESLAITKERDFTYPTSSGTDLYRRSLYTFWRRTVSPANMFDASNRQACRVRQSLTSTPLHALTTLNDPTWVEAARVLAESSLKQNADSNAAISIAFKRVLAREPKTEEQKLLQSAYEKQLKHFQQNATAAQEILSVGSAPRDQALVAEQHAAVTAICLAIMNLDEALTRQ
jgi:hypothetical protein